MIPDEIAPIWGPKGESILTFVAKDALILPQGHIVLTPDPGSARDPHEPTNTMIALKIEPEVASQYGVGPSAAGQAQQIPVDERHITLVYTGEQDELERKRLHDFTRKWLAKSDWPSLQGKPQGWGTFIPGGEKKPVLWMSWDIPGLNEMRADLLEELRANGFEFEEDHGFVPHETVAYYEDGEITDLPPFPDDPMGQDFNAVVVAEDDLWTEYPMPMSMGLLDGSTMSLTAALESAVMASIPIGVMAIELDLLGEGAASALRAVSDDSALIASTDTFSPVDDLYDPSSDMAVATDVSSAWGARGRPPLERDLLGEGAPEGSATAPNSVALSALASERALDRGLNPLSSVTITARGGNIEGNGANTASVKSALDVDLLRDGFQVIWVDTVEDSAEVVEIPLGLRSHGAIALGQGSDASLPNKAVGENLLSVPDDATVTVDGVDVASPQQAGSEVGTKLGDRSNQRARTDGLFAGGVAASGNGSVGVSSLGVDLVVTKAQSERRVLDLPLAAIRNARATGQGSTFAFLEDWRGERIPINPRTSVVTVAEFLGKDGATATIYGTDGRSHLASAALWISGLTPTFVVSATPASDLGGLRAVLDAADGQWSSLVAAGSLKGHTTGAATLKKYWLTGRGALKIRWNTPGDWERCVKHLSKYMGPRAKGYCQNLHKTATGLYTGDMKHRMLYGWGGKSAAYWKKVAAQSIDDGHNAVLVATSGETMPDENPILMMLGGPQQAPQGFRIPLLLPEGLESGDGRTFKEGVVELRDLPIPLLWQPNSMQGHDGAAIVGRIDKVERVEGGLGNATGVFDSSPLAVEAVRMIREGFLRGVSADLDRFEAKVKGKGKGPGTSEAKDNKDDGDEMITPDKMDITKGRVMAATLVAKPAFQECVIELDDPTPMPDGDYAQPLSPGEQEIREALAALLRESAMASFAITASAGFKAAPIYPPKDWFSDPKLTKRTHLSITDDGRVYGHIAAWDVNHIGMNFGVKPPKSRSGYAYFRTGLLRTHEGSDVRVGQLTLAGGHAGLECDVRETVRHYDDTASAWADVSAGEDRFGIWVAGSLRPTVTQEQVRAARASSPSGDWRPINGSLELVAVCSVNVPGFPVVEARVAGGQVMALVAAGVAALYADELATLDPGAAALAARERMYAPMQAKALAASATMARARVLSTQPVSAQRRKAMAKKGWALDDGSFPVADLADLKRAISSYGRAKESERPAVRKHISKRAHDLGHPELIPESWDKLAILEAAIYQGMTAALRSYKGPDRFDETQHSRDDVGRFRKIYYRLRNSPGSGAPEVKAALKAIKEAERISVDQGLTDPESAATARDALDAASVSNEIDERTQVEVIKAAEDMNDIMRRFEVRGPETMISFDQLPTEIQDVMKRYMKESNLEERITKHINPLIEGEVQRSVADIINFLERILVDKQNYYKGYDSSRV